MIDQQTLEALSWYRTAPPRACSDLLSYPLSGFILTVACFVLVVTRTGYCVVVGCCRNLAKHREGRHDLPLIYGGVSVSTFFSADGWRCLWSFMETEDCMCLYNTTGLTYLSYLSTDSRQFFVQITKTATVSVLWEFG